MINVEAHFVQPNNMFTCLAWFFDQMSSADSHHLARWQYSPAPLHASLRLLRMYVRRRRISKEDDWEFLWK